MYSSNRSEEEVEERADAAADDDDNEEEEGVRESTPTLIFDCCNCHIRALMICFLVNLASVLTQHFLR